MHRLILSALLALCAYFPAQAFMPPAKLFVAAIGPLIKSAEVLPDGEIVRLASLGVKTGGTKEIGRTLGKMNLPADVLEDSYMRIAIQQSKISRSEAEGVFSRLRGTPGLRSTISKIVGNSDVKTSGHLNELRIADNAAQNGFTVKGIGVTFNDMMKAAPTDINVLLERNGKTVAIEAKDYLSETPIPLIKFRVDMISLAEYTKQAKPAHVIPVFSMTNKPNNGLTMKILMEEADKNGVQLIFGSAEQQIVQVKQLLEIL